MKCSVPEISWHNRDPVLSVDVHLATRTSDQYRLATGGNDSHVVVWQVTVVDGDATAEALSDLTHHLKPVNVVRFAPTDEILLASADDDGHIILWRRQSQPDIMMEEDGAAFREHYSISKTLRGHLQDVYDLCWSADGSYIISGAVDNTAIMWDVQKGVKMKILSGHDSFVQGVAWDPLNKIVATLSCDRHCRIFNVQSGKCVAKMQKMKVSCQKEDGTVEEKACRLFHDDTLQTFCRRLTFTPEGSLLLAPAGLLEDGPAGRHANVVHVFSRHDFTRPVFCLPTGDKYTIAVRCCPTLFKLRMRSPPDLSRPLWEQTHNLLKLPYRMVMAVATRCSVLLYDTQQQLPFARISNIHFTRLTDLSWSRDGRLLMVSSTDGFCSMVTFAHGELGDVYEPAADSAAGETAARPTPVGDAAEPALAPSGDGARPLPAQPSLETAQAAAGPAEAARAAPEPARTPSKADGGSGRRLPLVTLSSPRRPTTRPPAAGAGPAEPPTEPEPGQEQEMETETEPATVDETSQLVLHLEETTRELDEGPASPAAEQPPPPQPSPRTPRRVPLVTLSSPRGRGGATQGDR